MICAPRQTIMLCVAALIVNAAASDFEKNSAGTLDAYWAERLPFALENSDVRLKKVKLTGLREFFGPEGEKSPGLAAALEKLGKKDYAAFADVLRHTAFTPSDPGRFVARMFLADFAYRNQEWFKAGALYMAVSNDSKAPQALVFQGTVGAVSSMIRAGADHEALALLNSKSSVFSDSQELWERLQVFLLGRTGDHLGLTRVWTIVRKKYAPAKDELLFEGLFKGGISAADSQMYRTAEGFFADAYEFASDNAARRNCLKKLIAVQEKETPEKALISIRRYLARFPGASDNGQLRLLEGELLVRTKSFSEALKLYRNILNNRSCDLEERMQAALRAAAVSEQNGDLSMAREFYNSAIRRFAAHPEQANRVKMQLLEFMLRTGEFSSAAVLGDELAGVSGVDQERLNVFRLKALLELKRYADAMLIARELAESEESVSAAEGAWQLARLAELQKKNSEAISFYLAFTQKFSGDKRVPEAFLAAGDLAVGQKDFKKAVEILEEYLKKFPEHSGGKKAMSAVVFSLLYKNANGDREKAEQILNTMTVRYPGSEENELAEIELIRYYCRCEEYASALKRIEGFLKRYESGKLMPEALLLGADTFEKMGNLDKAVAYVERLLDKYPSSPKAVEAAMLGGSCSFQAGKYQRALKYYERACELGGRGVMAQVAAGEAADCHLQLRKKENLRAAARIYRELANRSEFPALQIQALYKLGLAFEYSNQNMDALEAYEEMLSLAVSSEKVRESSGTALWCARGARSALRIILCNSNLPDGSQRAQRIYRLYSLLDLPGSTGELRSYLEEIRKHYNLLD